MIPPPEAEFGAIEAVEIKWRAARGAMQPLLCRGNDGKHYILKPFSPGGSWPLALEWICARLGRALGLPIPNYRQVVVSEEIASEWNNLNNRQINAGTGFGSQFVPAAMEFESSLGGNLPGESRLRVLAFDWWIRNRDRTEKNPNLLWCAGNRSLHVIDHDQAGQREDASLFWNLHLFRELAAGEPEWPPPSLAGEFGAALSRLLPSPVLGELPLEWTDGSGGIDWFVHQLKHSLSNTSHRDWRNHE